MRFSDIVCYFQKLFEDHIVVGFAAIGALLSRFLFPTPEYKWSAISVLCIFMLDLLTKLKYRGKRLPKKNIRRGDGVCLILICSIQVYSTEGKSP